MSGDETLRLVFKRPDQSSTLIERIDKAIEYGIKLSLLLFLPYSKKIWCDVICVKFCNFSKDLIWIFFFLTKCI